MTHWNLEIVLKFNTVEPLYRGHIETLETVIYIEVILNLEVEPLYKGHIGTLDTVIYIEVILNSEIILLLYTNIILVGDRTSALCMESINISEFPLLEVPLYHGIINKIQQKSQLLEDSHLIISIQATPRQWGIPNSPRVLEGRSRCRYTSSNTSTQINTENCYMK